MTLPWSLLVHQNIAKIATFAYSQTPLAQMRSVDFIGEWRFVDKALHQIPREEATKAVMELALYLRTLDDEQRLTEYWKVVTRPSVGQLVQKSGEVEDLSPREMSNKIIHAEQIEWQFEPEPSIICHGRDKERWVRAEISVKLLIWIGGMLGS